MRLAKFPQLTSALQGAWPRNTLRSQKPFCLTHVQRRLQHRLAHTKHLPPALLMLSEAGGVCQYAVMPDIHGLVLLSFHALASTPFLQTRQGGTRRWQSYKLGSLGYAGLICRWRLLDNCSLPDNVESASVFPFAIVDVWHSCCVGNWHAW